MSPSEIAKLNKSSFNKECDLVIVTYGGIIKLEELIDSKSKDIASHFSKLQIVREVDYKNGKCFIEI